MDDKKNILQGEISITGSDMIKYNDIELIIYHFDNKTLVKIYSENNKHIYKKSSNVIEIFGEINN